ncbi:MAG: histidinol-phosphate transaminase [Sphingobacteriaceae bacterium]|nr:histidinol-phosphate transaminase [Sphingobacteriaceae bacterium]
MFNLNSIVRENIKSLQSYKVWRDDYLDSNEAIFLDNCENNFGSPLGLGYERYPSSSQSKVKEAIATFKKLKANQVVIGNGSDELIDLLIRCFCEPKQDNILVCEPTFGMFKVYAQLNNVDVLNAPLVKESYLFDEKLILKTITSTTKLVFICSPNNPTGTSISVEQLKTIALNFNGIVVVDEAYIDFSEKQSAIELINEFENIIVLQTFSKAWGLAALRVGVAYADASIIEILNKVRPPFNINSNSQELILNALKKSGIKDTLVESILKQKAYLENELLQLSFVKNITESDANFLLVEVTDANKICSYLLEENILISNRSSLLNCENRIRISVGTEKENKQLITLLKQYN